MLKLLIVEEILLVVLLKDYYYYYYYFSFLKNYLLDSSLFDTLVLFLLTFDGLYY